jgi:hypothetical protein
MTQLSTTTELKIRTASPLGLKHRVSSQSAWPLRNADGLTFAEAKLVNEKGKVK